MTLEKKLRSFFAKYDPGRIRLAKKMAKQFRGKDDAIIAHLTKVYSSGGIDALKKRIESKPKKTKKLYEDVPEEVTAVVEETVESVEENIEAAADAVEDASNDAVENVEDLIDDLDD